MMAAKIAEEMSAMEEKIDAMERKVGDVCIEFVHVECINMLHSHVIVQYCGKHLVLRT